MRAFAPEGTERESFWTRCARFAYAAAVRGIPLLLVLSLVGCASLKRVSSGRVGCPESEIKITEDRHGWGTRTWTAECRGKRFFCSAHAAGESEQVSCQEEASDPEKVAVADPPAAPPAPAVDSGGCKYDTQCKGDRICVEGACVDPAGAPKDETQEL